MTISGFEILFYTITFLLPGYIIRATLKFLFPNKEEKLKHLAFLRLLTYGAVNFVVALLVATGIFGGKQLAELAVAGSEVMANGAENTEYEEVIQFRYLVAWAGVLFVQPVILGVLLAVVVQRGWMISAARKVGDFRPDLEQSWAWDYKFERTMDPHYVIVTLADETEIYGLFGDNSYAASSPENRDLYLEEVFEDEEWRDPEEPAGIWLSGDEIKRIEFLWVPGENEELNFWQKLKRYCQDKLPCLSSNSEQTSSTGGNDEQEEEISQQDEAS